MKKDYTVSSAKSMITRNRGKFEGKMIIIDSPGIKVLGAIDYLVAHGYGWNRTPPKKEELTFPQALAKAADAVKNLTSAFKKMGEFSETN